jgi:hypothetical protein
MKRLMTCLTAGLLMAGGQSLLAQTTTNSTPPTVQSPTHHHGDPGAILRLVGLTRADVKGLDKEARQAKIKEAALNVQSELNAKKAAGTLTPEGQKRLDRIDKLVARLNGDGAGTGTGTTDKPDTN